MRLIYWTLTLSLLLGISSMKSFASVWDDTQNWSVQYEEEFSAWISSNKVYEGMFVDKTSPYYGIKVDCADTAYAFRAIFAFEHKLPFAVKDPSGSRTNSLLSNKSKAWDKISAGTPRLIAMLNDLGEMVGTENLAHFDSYPQAIVDVSPGSVFMYKISPSPRKFIRHTYNVKNINLVGTFDTIYSTQANKAQGLPLIRKKEFEFSHAPQSPWGFKRIRWPEHIGKEIAQLPPELKASTSQYDQAQSLGEAGFFKMVKKTLAKTNETKAEKIIRLFQMVCSESMARIDYINQALVVLKKTNNACMDYANYDAYSTPSRDKTLKELYNELKEAYIDLKTTNELNTLSPDLISYAETIFDNKIEGEENLLQACPINYRTGVSISMATLFKRIEANRLSSHPNDIVELRWGEKTSPKTTCKAWY